MATEGGNASEYDPLLQPKLRAEAVRVTRGFSFAGAHVVIVGGLVPSLLVPQPEQGSRIDELLPAAWLAGQKREQAEAQQLAAAVGAAGRSATPLP